MLKFQNKTALITGSGTGIGRTVAKEFAENGASVIILGRRREPLEDTAGMLNDIIQNVQSSASVRIFANVDVSDQESVDQMFDELKRDGVALDYVINNAGVSGPVKCFVSSPQDEFKSAVDIHLTGTFWTSVRALDVMAQGGKIITISTFFTEERPLEQRPYRFRSPYTAAQGAKNRLAEALSWELTKDGIISIATNPGPVHSDRIYKTVYPKAAAEFMRVSGFEILTPSQVEDACKKILDLMGEPHDAVSQGTARAAESLAGSFGCEPKDLEPVLARLLDKIQSIAEKIQKNTSHMISDRQFLSQSQVAHMVLQLCDDDTAKILNGKVIPGDRVFYPVKPHIGTSPPPAPKPNLAERSVVFTVHAVDDTDVQRVKHLAAHVESSGGKAVCLVSENTPEEHRRSIEASFHTHVTNISDAREVQRWLDTASSKMGKISAIVHCTGNLHISRLADLSRQEWDSLVDRFIISTAVISRQAMEHFVPGGGQDPRLLRDASGAILVIGPDMPPGRISGTARAQIEVFRGALRPFTATVNQELSDVLKSKMRVFSAFAGTVAGSPIDHGKMAALLDFALSSDAPLSALASFCVDESR